LNLIARYASLDRFPVSAFINIGLNYLLAFSSYGVLALDLAFTLYARKGGQEGHAYKTEVFILWNIVYWGSWVIGKLNTFLSQYWQSGYLTMIKRVIHTL